MPTYEYQCEKCSYMFEEFQSITAKPLKKCPVCKKNSLQRLIGSGSGIIFKGSGFYQTDYRSDSYKSSHKSETSKPKEKTESKTETASKTSDNGKSTNADSAGKTKKKTG
jgi:putative FmdB family regulatory protein